MRRRFIEVAGWSALLFVALPLLVKALRGTFTDGVLMGTGAAIVWYTLETLALRKETASLREETAQQRAVAVKQNEIGIEQNRIALRQAETEIRPLLVTRIEELEHPAVPGWFPRFHIRNIGHGPALFVEVAMFTVNVWTKGDWRLEIAPVDLVEPGKAEVLAIRPHLPDGAGPGPHVKPDDTQMATSLRAGQYGNATASYDITITYEDVEKRRFETVMRMGNQGTRLLSYRVL